MYKHFGSHCLHRHGKLTCTIDTNDNQLTTVTLLSLPYGKLNSVVEQYSSSLLNSMNRENITKSHWLMYTTGIQYGKLT